MFELVITATRYTHKLLNEEPCHSGDLPGSFWSYKSWDFVMFWLIGNRVIIPLKINTKVSCSLVTWNVPKPTSHSVGTYPPPTPTSASKRERIKICLFLCLPLLSCQSCFTCCHPMLSFICVRRKDLTSSVYNVHLARQIFHTNFEKEMKLSFNGMSNIIFGQTYYEREDGRTLLPRMILRSQIHF